MLKLLNRAPFHCKDLLIEWNPKKISRSLLTWDITPVLDKVEK